MFGLGSDDFLAIVLLAGLAFGLAWFLVWQRRRLPLTWTQSFWYGVNQLVARILWRTRLHGPLPVAPGEGAVIVANHRSPLDPSFIELATGRVVHWMVAGEFFPVWGMGQLLRMAEAIPVKRGGIDRYATKTAIDYAKRGELVGLFPEGGINHTDQFLRPGRPGAALIAIKARVPIIPCYIRGAPYDGTTLGCFLMPAKVDLQIGQPIDLSEYFGREDDRSVLEEVTKRILTAIATLAGEKNFQPEVIGRFTSRTASNNNV